MKRSEGKPEGAEQHDGAGSGTEAILGARAMMTMTPKIDPDELYPAAKACELVPSRGGTHLHVRTLHKWRREGKVSAVRISGCWFIRGAEILRLLKGDHGEERHGTKAKTAE